MALMIAGYTVDYTDMRSVLIFLLVFLLTHTYMISKSKYWRLPPGPPALPILGSLPFLGPDVREPLRKMSKKYGDVFTIYLGQRPVVVLNSYDAIKDAFVKHAFAFTGRPQSLIFQEFTHNMGVASSEGDNWRKQRKFVHSVLRDFGVGRSCLDDKIQEELIYFIKRLEKHIGQPYNIAECIQMAVSNIICSITFGERYKYDDPTFKEYLSTLNNSFEIIGNAGALTVFPFLRQLPGDMFGWKQVQDNDVIMKQMYQKKIDDHRETCRPDVTRDVIDAYIKQIDKEDADPDFHDKQLSTVIGDLFGAGTETTATTLRWAIAFMLHYPEVQAKIQKEIDRVLGHERLPTMRDRPNMPYVQATIFETQRLGDIAPLGVPHSTTEDVYFRGYVLPKNIMIMANMYANNRDEKYWPEPFKFDPNRFLDADGKLDSKEYLIPFSMGKRVCLGESLAKTELFLFLTTMLQRFSFDVPKGHPLPVLTGIMTITSFPADYQVIITPRL